MNTSTSRNSGRQLLGIVVVILSAAGVRAETSPPPVTQKEFQEIEAAWKARTSQIRSLTMRVDAEELTKGRGDKPLDNDKNNPFGESLPKIDREFKIDIRYAFKQGKAALKRSGPIIDPDDPEKITQQTLRFSFDGHESRSLCEQTGFPTLGDFEKRDSPDAPAINNADILGINLWLESRNVVRAVWAPKMTKTVDEHAVAVDGVSCRRIRSRFELDNSGRTTTLDLDPKRGWLPLQWQKWSDSQENHLSMSLTIKYGDDAKIGPVPKEWTFTTFNPDGEYQKIRLARVTKYEVNGDVDDNRFTLNFPVGTRVSERASDQKVRQYVQKAAGLVPVGDAK